MTSSHSVITCKGGHKNRYGREWVANLPIQPRRRPSGTRRTHADRQRACVDRQRTPFPSAPAIDERARKRDSKSKTVFTPMDTADGGTGCPRPPAHPVPSRPRISTYPRFAARRSRCPSTLPVQYMSACDVSIAIAGMALPRNKFDVLSCDRCSQRAQPVHPRRGVVGWT